MTILHIASISDNKSVGPNINVPKNVIYGNKYANVALYNINSCNIVTDIPEGKYFSINNYKQISDLPYPYCMPDCVVFQGVYFYKYYKMAKKLSDSGIPYIIVPRCSLTEAAIKSKYLKKKVANYLFFNKFVDNAKKIQFLTENEYLESKKCFKFSDHFILGNGVEIPTKTYKIKNRKEFKIVYIGRYNIYHKGLDMLLESINTNKKWFITNNVKLDLYGSDSEKGLSFLKDFIKNNHLENIVSINDAVYDNEKEKILLEADVFIHTSRLEGQPTAVIEAISYGIPVIVTPGTNIKDIVRKNNLGYTCEFNSNSIFNCIKNAFNSKNNFKMISQNEIKYASDNFKWESIVKKQINIIKK